MRRRPLIWTMFFVLFVCAMVVGCAKREQPQQSQPNQPAPPDATTTASVVDTEAEFEKAIGKDGTWIICTTKDIKTDKDLVLEGTFTNGKKDEAGKEEVQRKIALYTQDEERKVSDRFTLEAPKLTIKSEEALLQGGTFKGDLIVESENFRLVDATVEGNVFFNSEGAKNSFKMDEDSKITGKQEVKA